MVGDRILFDHDTNLPAQSRKLGYVFQDLALFPHLTVGKNVEYGLTRQANGGKKLMPSSNPSASRICATASRERFPAASAKESPWPGRS